MSVTELHEPPSARRERPSPPKPLTPDERRTWFRALKAGDRIHVREKRNGNEYASPLHWPAIVTETRMQHLGNGNTRWWVKVRVEASHGIFTVTLPDDEWLGSPYSEYHARVCAISLLRHRAMRILSGAPQPMVVRVLETMLGEQVVAHGVPLDVLLVDDDDASSGVSILEGTDRDPTG